MLVCVTFVSFLVERFNNLEAKWKETTYGPEMGMKKLPQVILIGARHCGAGQGLLSHDSHLNFFMTNVKILWSILYSDP